MKHIVLVSTLLGLFIILVPAYASGLVSPSNFVNFETVCLKSNDLCRYVELDFSEDGTVDNHTVIFLPVGNHSAAAFWNDHAKEDIAHDMQTHVQVAVYDARTHKWLPIAANGQCALCVPAVLLNGASKRWVRFDTDHVSTWQSVHSPWAFKRIIGRGEHSRLFIVVNSPNRPIVYASMRNSGANYHYSTRQRGAFRVLLESGWVPSARPDYVVISPVRSWVDVGHAYMRAQAGVLTGEDQLPGFTGSVEQIVDKAVGYIASRDIRYDDKQDVGGYPIQTVAAVLADGMTDCKGFTTLLYAVLRKSGVESHPVAFNAYGMTPLSFSVPDNWSDHVMLYVPAIDRYIDLTVNLPSRGKYTWQDSANPYAGDVVLDLVTGQFEVVP